LLLLKEAILLKLKKMWFTSYCLSPAQKSDECDWSTDNSDCLVTNTLRRDYLLVQLQELQDSTTAEAAEAALRAIDEEVSTDEPKFLKFLQQAGTLPIIYEVLNRKEDGKPSPLVAASLLFKFAENEIGFVKTPQGQVIAKSDELVKKTHSN
jgi:hypothetical protein